MSFIYDSHIHLMPDGRQDTPLEFQAKAAQAGIGGGLIFSQPPSDAQEWETAAPCWQDRIAHVLDFCSRLEHFYPVYWINPTEPDAIEQIVYAKNAGIRAFKVLCSFCHPADGLEAYRKMAELRLPVIFHSGILWDGVNSSPFNRPANFECMLDVPYSRFALAHVSWPWTDECIAVFGKILCAHTRKKSAPEMYIDTAPGAPAIYRDDIFRNMILTGYAGLEDKLMFAVDGFANDYGVDWAKFTVEYDRAMFRRLQEKYGKWQGFRGNSCMEGDNSITEEYPFVKTWENATQRNMLNFIAPW